MVPRVPGYLQTHGFFRFKDCNPETPHFLWFHGSPQNRPKGQCQVSQAMLLLVQKHQAFQDLSRGPAPQQGTWQLLSEAVKRQSMAELMARGCHDDKETDMVV